jgi:hypothetical protein
MAIKIYEQFAPFANPADGDYPYGSIKNDSIPGAEDGTPLDAVWANDYAGSDAELFAQAGIVPNSQPDKLGASQRVEAIKQLEKAASKVSNANGGSVQDFIDKVEGGDLTVIADGSTTPRRLGERFADVGTVDDCGAVANGVDDDTQAFADAVEAFGICRLGHNKRYKITSLPTEANLVIEGNKSTIVYSNILIDRQFDNLDLRSVRFDAEGSDLSRCIRVRADSKVRFRDVQARNVTSSTFLRVFDFSTENVELDLEDMYCDNLSADSNGIVGDINGSCRFVYVGDEDATPLVKPSSGRIVNIRGKNLLPAEDGDMIHIQSSDTKIFEILISNIFGDNIAKRVVKVQCNGVDVSHVDCVARDNAVNMFSIVSHYGQFGSVQYVSGVGKFINGVDTNWETTEVSEINVTNTGTATSQGAGFKSAGSGNGNGITSYGFEHVCAFYGSLQEGGDFNVNKVRGSCTGIPVFVRAAINLGRIAIDDVDAETTGNLRLVRVTKFTGSAFLITSVEINRVRGETTTFTAVDVSSAENTEVKDVKAISGGTTVTIFGGVAKVRNVDAMGSIRAVLLNGTTKALVEQAEGATGEQIRTQGCNNTVALNTITTSGVDAVEDEFSNPSTNTQEIQTITFV